ncbi:MAG: ATP-binding cassette domain-containing protein [Desulfohalobiaceae bacterium]|nr:ATP-binding cassette domain-containing protein [Desulfohalobiaceae bacterium]
MTLLQVTDISKRFGGVKAVEKMQFDIGKGEIVGLIGPNGAGKTTLLNLISGLYSCDFGHIYLDGLEITNMAPHKRSLVGIGRTFQVVQPFEMTVLENVMVPALARERNPHKARTMALEVLEFMKLEKYCNLEPENLTLAMKKRIEVARALVTRPKLLLLDEVLAGLNPTEISENLPLITQVRDTGITILYIEHIMDAIMKVSERILVMNEGELIATGTPEEVIQTECVIKAYLGEEVLEC